MSVQNAKVDRIAVRLGASGATDPDTSIRSANIFDDDRLSSEALIRSATIRPATSVGPPAANGTIMVIGRVG